MVLKKEKVLLSPPRGKKPTRFRFRGNLRLGFRNNKVVEIVEFKKKKGGKK